MRISDISYTTNLPDVPEPTGKPIPINFYQGEDIVINFYLTFNGEPVTEDKWDIVGTVKKNQYAQNVLWEAKINNGLYKQKPDGYYQVILPSEASATFLSGTYWLVVMIHEKSGEGPKDLDLVVLNQPFSINYSAASPNPGKALDRTATEQTYPPPVMPDTI